MAISQKRQTKVTVGFKPVYDKLSLTPAELKRLSRTARRLENNLRKKMIVTKR